MAGGLVALLLVLVLGGSLGALYARSFQSNLTNELRAGMTELEKGKTDLTHATGDSAQASILSAGVHFNRARSDFRSADRLVTDNWLLQHAGVGPAGGYLQPRLRAVHLIAQLGIAIADAGTDALPMQEALVGPAGQGLSAGQRLVSFLKGSGPQLARLEADLQRAAVAGAGIDPSYLPSGQRAAFLAARASITTGLDGIKSLRDSLAGLLDILGANGMRTYLIEQMNPAELRAGGGFIGSYGILRVDGGKFGLIQSAGIAEADYPRPDVLNHCIDARYNPAPCKGHTYVKPPAVLQDFLGDKSWVLGDSNFWPDFPTSSRAAETLTQKELQTKVDGVIAIDPQFLADLLQLTGPIKAPGFDFQADPKTFTKDLFEYENGKAAGPATVRKAMFTFLAPILIDKITTLPAGRWGDLVKELNTAAAAHDLQVFFNNDAAEKEVGGYGWGGVVPVRPAADYMMEVESNLGGTKANQFVARKFDVQLTAAGAVLHHKVTVTLTNTMPAGKYEGENFYRCYTRFYYAAAGTDGRAGNVLPDKHRTDEAPPAGLHMVDGWQQVNVDPKTQTGTDHMVFEYDTPWDARAVHDIYWQKQAGTVADRVTVTYTVNGAAHHAEGDLGQDRVIHIAGDSVTIESGLAGSAKLPGVSL